ncbi:DUF5709 domain-containing protein [Streptomyces sp. NPDC046557]|uniref:DUF5709 domain-containing protein n=1 Tax=Streptomyces sp. NPDC046557 TaxID=3155372 RepID=UPI0033C3F3D7
MAEDSNTQGDEVYQPQNGDQRAEYQPDMENALDEPDADQRLDEGYDTPDRPRAVSRHGTTAAEQREGETLDQRLAQETPDVGQDGTDSGPHPEPLPGDTVGRLAPVEDDPRRSIDVLAHDVGADGGAESAEEAAMHVVGRNRAPEPREHARREQAPRREEQEPFPGGTP